MRIIRIAVATAAALLIVGLARTPVAMAQQPNVPEQAVAAQAGGEVNTEHVVSGQSLGLSSIATDVWSLQCGFGTARIRFQLLDAGGVDGNLITGVVINPVGRAQTATTSDGGVSPLVFFAASSGSYLVTVGRTRFTGTAEFYSLLAHCETSTGVSTVHNLLLVQNQ